MDQSSLHPISTKVTGEEFLSWPEDGKRYELIEGEVYVTPSPAPLHQKIITTLAYYFKDYFRRNPVGEIYVGPWM